MDEVMVMYRTSQVKLTFMGQFQYRAFFSTSRYIQLIRINFWIALGIITKILIIAETRNSCLDIED